MHVFAQEDRRAGQISQFSKISKIFTKQRNGHLFKPLNVNLFILNICDYHRNRRTRMRELARDVTKPWGAKMVATSGQNKVLCRNQLRGSLAKQRGWN